MIGVVRHWVRTVTNTRLRKADPGKSCHGWLPALDQLQFECLEYGPGAITHAELGEGEAPLLARHRLAGR